MHVLYTVLWISAHIFHVKVLDSELEEKKVANTLCSKYITGMLVHLKVCMFNSFLLNHKQYRYYKMGWMAAWLLKYF